MIPTRYVTQNALLTKAFIILFLFLGACKKDTEYKEGEYRVLPSAGENVTDVKEFEVKLNADSLKSNETGEWTVLKGLVEDLVYFDDRENPGTVFHGLPGEEYELEWTVVTKGGKQSITTKSQVIVSFQPLTTSIENLSLTRQTKFHLLAEPHEWGEWTIEGKYAYILGENRGGVYVAPENSPFIEFQGYANTPYKLTWTTHYGSKSASASIDLKTGNYLEIEALVDLQMDANSSRVKYNKKGQIIELDLSSMGRNWVFRDTVQFPAMQALVHLTKLNILGSGLEGFPDVISAKYHQLEFLDLSYNIIGYMPEDIGRLTKLKTLIMCVNQQGAKLQALPESFGNLASLEYLDIAGIGLENIPESFSRLRNLKVFDYQLNPVKKLPDNLGDLKALEVLMGYCEGDIPASFSKLEKLRKAYLFIGAKSASLPNDVGNLKTLDTLKLSGNFKELPESFCLLTNLKSFELGADNSPPTLERLPSDFGNLVKLEALQLTGVFTSLPSSFSNLSSLETFILSLGKVEYFPNDFGRLTNLTWLGADNGRLKELPETIGQLKNLRVINVANNQIKELPESFYDFPKIEKIYLGDNLLSTLSTSFSKLSKSLLELSIDRNDIPAIEVENVKKLLPNTHIFFDSHWYY